jgi:hypothetical protein
VGLQFNIEEIVAREVQDRSLKEFGSVNVPRILRAAQSKASDSRLMLTVS